jgi:hypothetical protein
MEFTHELYDGSGKPVYRICFPEGTCAGVKCYYVDLLRDKNKTVRMELERTFSSPEEAIRKWGWGFKVIDEEPFDGNV